MTVNGEVKTAEQLLNLGSAQNNVTIKFGSFHFGKKTPNYWYRFSENTQWISTQSNQINLNGLRPGEYQLLISPKPAYIGRVSTSLSFNIQNPFTQTPLFYVLVFVLGGGLVFFFLWTYLSREKLTNRLLVSQQQALTSQMNPHFIFNALSSIQFFIGKGDKELAQSYLSSFAQLIRGVLDSSAQQEVSLKKELEGLRDYIELEELRFIDRATCKIVVAEDVQARLSEITLPTMIIQPYIENAILHGLHPKKGKGNLLLSLSLKNETLSITIEDDGIGREASQLLKKRKAHKSRGMSITKKRIELINKRAKHKILVSIEDMQPSGTKVALIVPVKRT